MRKTILLGVFTLFCSLSFALDLRVSGFNPGGFIPVEYTCSGEDISPQVSWTNVPENTRSFALVCEDPDAPMGVWSHWVIYNIPSATHFLPQSFPKIEKAGSGILQGLNDFGRVGYNGPCPPEGRAHHYYFKLYALDIALKGKIRLTRQALLAAIKGHILASAEYVGLFQR